MANNSLFIIDYSGTKFPIKTYNRIICLVPSLTEVLFTFGLEKNIVGVTKYCVFPPHAREKPRTVIGGTKSPNIEQIISLKPDIIIINQEENQLKHYTKLLEANIPIFVTFPKRVEDALKLFFDLEALFGVSQNDELDNLDKLIKEIQRKKDLNTDKINKKVFCPIWKKPWMSFNNDTFASAIIEFCGGINICKDFKDRYPEISIEDIIRNKPDVILLPDEQYKFTVDDKKEIIKLFKIDYKNVQLIDGTFHWYSIVCMLKSLNILYELCNT